jgi:hypothetical protein
MQKRMSCALRDEEEGKIPEHEETRETASEKGAQVNPPDPRSLKFWVFAAACIIAGIIIGVLFVH